MKKPKVYEEDNEFQSKTPLRAMVVSSDDWYPSFPDGKVEMTFYPDDNYMSIWGDDDFGMEHLDLRRSDFYRLSKMVINQEMLKKLGFKNI